MSDYQLMSDTEICEWFTPFAIGCAREKYEDEIGDGNLPMNILDSTWSLAFIDNGMWVIVDHEGRHLCEMNSGKRFEYTNVPAALQALDRMACEKIHFYNHEVTHSEQPKGKPFALADVAFGWFPDISLLPKEDIDWALDQTVTRGAPEYRK